MRNIKVGAVFIAVFNSLVQIDTFVKTLRKVGLDTEPVLAVHTGENDTLIVIVADAGQIVNGIAAVSAQKIEIIGENGLFVFINRKILFDGFCAIFLNEAPFFRKIGYRSDLDII